MGEASRRRKARLENEKLIKPMSPARFHLRSIGVQKAMSRLMTGEVSYWSDEQERLLGLISVDYRDKDYYWLIMARDRIGRFRACNLDGSIKSEQLATEMLLAEMAKLVREGIPHDYGFQGDEPNAPFDLMAVTHDAKLAAGFEILLNDPGRHPARSALKEIGPWLAPSDPHFVREFQTTAFDQRIWELYLWAAFRELGFDVEQPEAPDFLCSTPFIEFTVEATTVAPSTSGVLAKHPNPQTNADKMEFLKHYMPIKFGSSLTSKLNKKNAKGEPYWERPETKGKPFILAIADFHKPGDINEIGSMTYTHSALWPYLYGRRVEIYTVDGVDGWREVKGEDHVYEGKVVPTGFFDLPGAENISAVLFSNAGTLAKFDRMGVRAGFVPPDHTYIRHGLRYNPDPAAIVGIPFFSDVSSSDYEEYWSDELQIFHNPNAKNPISPDTFGGIAQYYFKGGSLHMISPKDAVIASYTTILRVVGDEEEVTKQ